MRVPSCACAFGISAGHCLPLYRLSAWKAYRADGLHLSGLHDLQDIHARTCYRACRLCPSMWWKPIIHPHSTTPSLWQKSSCVWSWWPVRTYRLSSTAPHRIPGNCQTGCWRLWHRKLYAQNLVLQWFQMQPSVLACSHGAGKVSSPKWDLSQWHSHTCRTWLWAENRLYLHSVREMNAFWGRFRWTWRVSAAPLHQQGI